MVRIPGSHPGGPGSIPGIGNFFLSNLAFKKVLAHTYKPMYFLPKKYFKFIYNNFSFRNGCLTWSITSTHPRCTSSTFASSTSLSKFSIEFFKEGFHNQIQKYSSFMNAEGVFLVVQLNCSYFTKFFYSQT